MGLFKKKNAAGQQALKSFTGRQLKYVSKRVQDNNGVSDQIIGKGGRVALSNGVIKVIIGTKSVFSCKKEAAECNLLMSGNGATIEGVNLLNGIKERITVHYSKL